MNKMGMYEFKQYLDSPQLLAEKQREYRLFEQRGYADIHPTRMGYDYGQGKMFKESLNVADYAIWLVESKEIIEKEVEFWEQRVVMLQKAIDTLSDDEWLSFKDFRQNKHVNRSVIEPILLKLKKELEVVISVQSIPQVLPHPEIQDTVLGTV